MYEKVLDKLKHKNIDKYELVVKENSKKNIIVKKGKIDNLKDSKEVTFTLRILKNNKIGFTYFTNKDSNIDEVIERAIELANFNTPDKLNDFYNNNFPDNNVNNNLFNKDIEKLNNEQQLNAALLIEESAYKFNKKIHIVNESQCFKGSVKVNYFNSYGISKEYFSNYIGGAVVAVARNEDNQMIGYEHYISKNSNIDSESIGKNAAKKAVRMLNAIKGKSMKCPVIIENELVADILTIIAPSFYIENIDKKKSLFANYNIGDNIASSNLNLIDDATDCNYIGVAKFDDEGAPTNKKILIKDGYLNNFLYNLYFAKKYNNNFAGNSFLPNFKNFQSITYTNLILQKGSSSLNEYLPLLKNGLFLTTLMGLHMADPISGDFSLGAEGILIENGEMTIPVKEIIVSGNIKDLLKNCKAVFNDIKASGSIITPSILVEGLTISGN